MRSRTPRKETPREISPGKTDAPLAFTAPAGFVEPRDSRARRTPWSVFQDGSGGQPSAFAADPKRAGAAQLAEARNATAPSPAVVPRPRIGLANDGSLASGPKPFGSDDRHEPTRSRSRHRPGRGAPATNHDFEARAANRCRANPVRENVPEPLIETRRRLTLPGRSLRFRPFTPCLLYTSPSPRDATLSRMPSSA